MIRYFWKIKARFRGDISTRGHLKHSIKKIDKVGFHKMYLLKCKTSHPDKILF